MIRKTESRGEVIKLGTIRSERKIEQQIKKLLDTLNALPKADLSREDPRRAEVLRDLESATSALAALKESKKKK